MANGEWGDAGRWGGAFGGGSVVATGCRHPNMYGLTRLDWV